MLIGDILLWVGSCGVTVALLHFRFRNRVFMAGGQTIMLSEFRPNSDASQLMPPVTECVSEL